MLSDSYFVFFPLYRWASAALARACFTLATALWASTTSTQHDWRTSRRRTPFKRLEPALYSGSQGRNIHKVGNILSEYRMVGDWVLRNPALVIQFVATFRSTPLHSTALRCAPLRSAALHSATRAELEYSCRIHPVFSHQPFGIDNWHMDLKSSGIPFIFS